MQARLDYKRVAPDAVRVMRDLDNYVHQSGLEPSLLELVKVRASQINGCAYCIDMHTKDARAGGETEQRLYALPAWQETPFYTDRERAALLWTEVLTHLPSEDVADEVYDLICEQFSEKELVDLTMAVVAINGWNRLGVAFRTVPGSYQPATRRGVSTTSDTHKQ